MSNDYYGAEVRRQNGRHPSASAPSRDDRGCSAYVDKQESQRRNHRRAQADGIRRGERGCLACGDTRIYWGEACPACSIIPIEWQ